MLPLVNMYTIAAAYSTYVSLQGTCTMTHLELFW